MSNFIVSKENLKEILNDYPNLKKTGLNGDGEIGFEIFEKCVHWMDDKLSPFYKYEVDSYELKHRIESEINTYVPNGAVIAAAHFLAILQRKDKNNSLNTKMKAEYIIDGKKSWFDKKYEKGEI